MLTLKDRPHPSDQKVRDRFAKDFERNYSVIAPAGVGKTASIVDRVIAIATSNEQQALEILPKLVVVTYTNRAADEMQQRARTAILERKVSTAILVQFNRAFFGTIHSFCLKLLRTYGFHIGLPPKFDLVQDEDALWCQFVRQIKSVGSCLSTPQMECLQRHRSLLDVIALGKKLDVENHQPSLAEKCPDVDLSRIMIYTGRSNAQKNIDAWKQRLTTWAEEKSKGSQFLPLPVVDTGGEGFKELCREAFEPMRMWLNDASWLVAKELSHEFRRFRLKRGEITYNDQTYLSSELLRNPIAGRKIREEKFRIILDEAQDTDPTQFQVLLEVARHSEVTDSWIESSDKRLRAGHFSMVGDPQQSIYSNRADLQFYQKVRKELINSNSADELIFEVTFRCDKMIVDSVNQIAPSMLHGEGNQVSYVPLKLRPGPDDGQVCRLLLKNALQPNVNGKRHKDGVLERHEVRQIAKWIHSQGLEKLRVSSWSEVAILCPRKSWFGPLVEALHAENLSVQVQSPDDILGEEPTYAWFTALMIIFSEPENAYEIVGVLREVFALSDDELARFSGGKSSVFKIRTLTEPAHGKVSDVLNFLHQIYLKMASQSVRDAVRTILEEVNLKDRLLSIPDMDSNDVELRIDELLMQATIADDQGMSFREWAEYVKTDFWNLRDEKTPQRDSIQLITCQKAKGLQWQAVIIPFIFRDIKNRNETFPRVISRNAAGTPWIAFNKNDVPDEVQSRIEESRLNEMQRILYVALTRARKTLILIDDETLFQDHKHSFADCMVMSKGSSRAIWEGLPTDLTSEEVLIESIKSRYDVSQAFAVNQTIFESAREASRGFIQRTLPHSLARHWSREELEIKLGDGIDRPESTISEAAILYGLWWHELMESIALCEMDRWDEIYKKQLFTSPDRDRSQNEWRIFLESEACKYLTDPSWLIKAEMPFLYRTQETACVEGIMDLVLVHKTMNDCIILDWKTNRINASGFSRLVENYMPQISAYAEGLKKITAWNVTAGIYSTATGLSSFGRKP